MTEDEIILALTQQAECYRRLARLAEAQHEHVQQSRTDALLEVLGQRQQVLDQITALEQLVQPSRKRWAAFLGELGERRRQVAEGLLAETRRLLEQITSADRNDTLVLQQRKVGLGKEIGAAKTARQVNRSYAAAAYGQRRPTMDLQR
jgi:hypothetical protein